MKAVAVYPRSKEIRLIDADEPKLEGADRVKTRTLDVGVCGTDREIASFQYGDPPPGSDRLIVGHESLGEAVQVGRDVQNVRPGDLVVWMVRRPCNHPDCLACRSGRQDFCYSGDYAERGIKGRDGYMAEFVVDQETYAVKVPAELRCIGVLAEPLTIAEKALEEVSRVQQRLPWGPGSSGRTQAYRHRAVVVGAGPVGLLGALLLTARDFEVHVYSREASDDPRAQIVQAIGAQYTCSREVKIEDFAKRVGNIDLVYEATGAAQVSFYMLEQLGVNGVFVFTGVPGRKAPFDMDGARIMRNMVLHNQVLFGTVNAPRQAYEDAVSDLGEFNRRWPDAVGSLITSRQPIEQAPTLLTAAGEGIKNTIQFCQDE